jgi:hypothetical protein
MTGKRIEVTPEEGRAALHGHLIDKATVAREKYGPVFDEGTLRMMLEDPEVARFPTSLVFGDDDLMSGEFAWARPRGERPSDGFDLVVHPFFRDRGDALPLLVGYHLPSVNYLDVASREEAELFGAVLNGMEVDTYYERLCELADSIPGAPVPVGHTASLVVALKPGLSEAEVEALRAELAARPDCAVGRPVHARLPVVLESPDAAAAEEATRLLGRMPGVAAVEVVAVGLEDCGGGGAAQAGSTDPVSTGGGGGGCEGGGSCS